MKEIWKDIKSYKGKYQVSNLGNVYSFKTNRILKPAVNRHGYKLVGLCKNGKLKSCKPHRLVAESFLPNKDKTLQVNHIDGVKTNNRLDNLEWVTRSENVSHAYSLGLMDKRGELNCKSKLKVKDVIKIRELHSKGLKPPEIAKKYCIHICNIRRIIKRETWKHI